MGAKHNRREFLRRSAAGVGIAAAAGAPRARAAAAARPNIVLIIADDMGYSDLGCFGGEIGTPNLDRLAAQGLRMPQFYNNAKCAPTRASLLTGLYSQQVGCHDGPVEMRRCATLAEVLRAAGYRTLMAGKWHAAQLPTDRGFDRYYGLADGCCNYFNPGEQRPGEPKPAEKNYPRAWNEDGRVMRPYTPGARDFYTTDAFTGKALDYLDEYGGADRPFFLYLAYTAPHYPLQAWPDDIARHRGKYAIGWDEVRRQRHARQLEMGLIDARWALAPRPGNFPAWERAHDPAAWEPRAYPEKQLPMRDATDRDLWDLKMAVYAAMVERLDRNVGRVLDKLEALGKREDTLVVFLSDNGGCAELRNDTPGVAPGPMESYRSVDPPWAFAQNTPFRKYKRHDHEGGISTPFVARWPARIAPGRIAHEVGHVRDLMPTVLDIAGARYPEGLPALEGQSLAPLFDGRARGTYPDLCWQFGPSRAIRRGTWKAVGDHFGAWELYDMANDRTETNDLAAARPEVASELAAAWGAWATRCGAKPLPA